MTTFFLLTVTLMTTLVTNTDAAPSTQKSNCYFDKNLSTLVCRGVDNFAVVKASVKENLVTLMNLVTQWSRLS